MGHPDHPVRHLDARNEVQVAYSDHAAAHEVFGRPDEMPLEEGLERMAGWVATVGARKSPTFGEIEVMRKLPPFWVDGEE